MLPCCVTIDSRFDCLIVKTIGYLFQNDSTEIGICNSGSEMLSTPSHLICILDRHSLEIYSFLFSESSRFVFFFFWGWKHIREIKKPVLVPQASFRNRTKRPDCWPDDKKPRADVEESVSSRSDRRPCPIAHIMITFYDATILTH